LTGVPDLSRFHFLRELWLNNNKIRELSCHSLNCCLTELYLHNNNIKSISGALNHLTCLRLLFLHNNQIRGLEETMHELRRMQQLRTATFFLNPISHEPGYRLHVIHCLPSIQTLDGKGKSKVTETSAWLFLIFLIMGLFAVRGEVSGEEEVLPGAQPGATSRPAVCGLLQTGDIVHKLRA
ncbi:hypothetical protein L3Q82_012989, partial [Scortum barcoo]